LEELFVAVQHFASTIGVLVTVLSRPLTKSENSELATAKRQHSLQKTPADKPSYLETTVEKKIIPRLVAQLANVKQRKLENISRLPLHLSARQISEFSILLLTKPYEECRDYALQLCHAGCSINEIYYSLAVDAARNLEYLWEADACTFGSSTIAIGHLQAILRELNPLFHTQGKLQTQTIGNALVVAAPGSQHSLGVFLLTENLIQHGWNVLPAAKITGAEILQTLKNSFFNFIAISIGSRKHWEELEDLIPSIRQASLNPQLHIMVGGALLKAQPELLSRSSADSCTTDLDAALKTAASLVK
jgi:methanogenic corrinoid protein MtbC1